MDVFSNREIALGIWLFIAALYVLFSPKMIEARKALIDVKKSFSNIKIILPLVLMIIYMSFSTYLLSELDLWNIGQLKNTVIWGISVGFLSFFKIETLKTDTSYFRHSVTDNLRLLAIVQFVVGVYSFPLLLEVFIVPLIFVLGVALALTESDDKLSAVKKLLNGLLAILGSITIVYTAYMLVTDFGEFGNENTLYDFIVPPLLTVSYIPFLYLLVVYSSYEEIFWRLKYFVKNRRYRVLAKFYVIFVFNFQLGKLDRWFDYIKRVDIQSHGDLVRSFFYVFRVVRSEKKRKPVAFKEGWSPYEAKDFLVNQGLETGHYKMTYDDEWGAISPMKNFGDGLISDNIAYYVDGSETIATSLKIKVNVNDAVRAEGAKEKLLEAAKVLSDCSLGVPIKEEFRLAIKNGKPFSEKFMDRKVSIIIDEWQNHHFNGYSMKFIISV